MSPGSWDFVTQTYWQRDIKTDVTNEYDSAFFSIFDWKLNNKEQKIKI